jgi:archaellum biogenesis ATPase FlaH
MLPLNFFNTKKLVDNGKIVYLKQDDDSFKEAKLYRFDYT